MNSSRTAPDGRLISFPVPRLTQDPEFLRRQDSLYNEAVIPPLMPPEQYSAATRVNAQHAASNSQQLQQFQQSNQMNSSNYAESISAYNSLSNMNTSYTSGAPQVPAYPTAYPLAQPLYNRYAEPAEAPYSPAGNTNQSTYGYFTKGNDPSVTSNKISNQSGYSTYPQQSLQSAQTPQQSNFNKGNLSGNLYNSNFGRSNENNTISMPQDFNANPGGEYRQNVGNNYQTISGNNYQTTKAYTAEPDEPEDPYQQGEDLPFTSTSMKDFSRGRLNANKNSGNSMFLRRNEPSAAAGSSNAMSLMSQNFANDNSNFGQFGNNSQQRNSRQFNSNQMNYENQNYDDLESQDIHQLEERKEEIERFLRNSSPPIQVYQTQQLRDTSYGSFENAEFGNSRGYVDLSDPSSMSNVLIRKGREPLMNFRMKPPFGQQGQNNSGSGQMIKNSSQMNQDVGYNDQYSEYTDQNSSQDRWEYADYGRMMSREPMKPLMTFADYLKSKKYDSSKEQSKLDQMEHNNESLVDQRNEPRIKSGNEPVPQGHEEKTIVSNPLFQFGKKKNETGGVFPPPPSTSVESCEKKRDFNHFTGVVTQVGQNCLFGMIECEVFFQNSNVVGENPIVGDIVEVEAEYVEAMPFKWYAKKVQVKSSDKDRADYLASKFRQAARSRSRSPNRLPVSSLHSSRSRSPRSRNSWSRRRSLTPEKRRSNSPRRRRSRSKSPLRISRNVQNLSRSQRRRNAKKNKNNKKDSQIPTIQSTAVGNEVPSVPSLFDLKSSPQPLMGSILPPPRPMVPLPFFHPRVPFGLHFRFPMMPMHPTFPQHPIPHNPYQNAVKGQNLDNLIVANANPPSKNIGLREKINDSIPTNKKKNPNDPVKLKNPFSVPKEINKVVELKDDPDDLQIVLSEIKNSSTLDSSSGPIAIAPSELPNIPSPPKNEDLEDFEPHDSSKNPQLAKIPIVKKQSTESELKHKKEAKEALEVELSKHLTDHQKYMFKKKQGRKSWILGIDHFAWIAEATLYPDKKPEEESEEKTEEGKSEIRNIEEIISDEDEEVVMLEKIPKNETEVKDSKPIQNEKIKDSKPTETEKIKDSKQIQNEKIKDSKLIEIKKLFSIEKSCDKNEDIIFVEERTGEHKEKTTEKSESLKSRGFYQNASWNEDSPEKKPSDSKHKPNKTKGVKNPTKRKSELIIKDKDKNLKRKASEGSRSEKPSKPTDSKSKTKEQDKGQQDEDNRTEQSKETDTDNVSINSSVLDEIELKLAARVDLIKQMSDNVEKKTSTSKKPEEPVEGKKKRRRRQAQARRNISNSRKDPVFQGLQLEPLIKPLVKSQPQRDVQQHYRSQKHIPHRSAQPLIQRQKAQSPQSQYPSLMKSVPYSPPRRLVTPDHVISHRSPSPLIMMEKTPLREYDLHKIFAVRDIEMSRGYGCSQEPAGYYEAYLQSDLYKRLSSYSYSSSQEEKSALTRGIIASQKIEEEIAKASSEYKVLKSRIGDQSREGRYYEEPNLQANNDYQFEYERDQDHQFNRGLQAPGGVGRRIIYTKEFNTPLGRDDSLYYKQDRWNGSKECVMEREIQPLMEFADVEENAYFTSPTTEPQIQVELAYEPRNEFQDERLWRVGDSERDHPRDLFDSYYQNHMEFGRGSRMEPNYSSRGNRRAGGYMNEQDDYVGNYRPGYVEDVVQIRR